MSDGRRTVWALLLAGILSACSVGPDYIRPQVDSPQAWRIDYPAAADVANIRWWEQFRDPVLNELMETALRDNKDVRIAAARMEEFSERVNIARAGYYPQIGYNAQASRNRGSRENFGGIPAGTDRKYNDYSAALSAGWEIDLWGRIRRSTEAARADLLAQEENRRAVILSLVSSVASSYISLRQLDGQLEIARRTLQTRAENLKLFKLKFKGGVISELELAQVRVEYEQAAAAIPPSNGRSRSRRMPYRCCWVATRGLLRAANRSTRWCFRRCRQARLHRCWCVVPMCALQNRA